MKNAITQFSLVIIAFVVLSLLMSYTRPAADEPKQYIVVYESGMSVPTKKVEQEVNQKISEGWRPIGGVTISGSGCGQAMVK